MNTEGKTALVMTVGVSGCGKSTWGKKFAQENNIIYLSSDETRAKFGKGEDDQSVTPAVFSYLNHEVDRLLSTGNSVMVDATNINRKDRRKFLDAALKYDAYKIAVAFECDRETLVRRQDTRAAQGGRRVPDWVIDKMLMKYEKPTEQEFNKIIWK
jgi:protein phosphatase